MAGKPALRRRHSAVCGAWSGSCANCLRRYGNDLSMRRPVAASNRWMRRRRWPGAPACRRPETTRPGSRASSVASPTLQASTVSAPRYSAWPHQCRRSRAPPAADALRPDAAEHVRRRPVAPGSGRRCRASTMPALPSVQREQVHRRRADEAGGETRCRTRIDFRRRCVLLDMAVAQQHDLVGHAHGLGLVVRDVQHGDAQPALQRQDLAPHVGTKLRVQVRQRFVHQADRRLGDDRAAERDALLLSAGELRRACVPADARCRESPPRAPAGESAPARAHGAPSGRTRCSPPTSGAGNSA